MDQPRSDADGAAGGFEVVEFPDGGQQDGSLPAELPLDTLEEPRDGSPSADERGEDAVFGPPRPLPLPPPGEQGPSAEGAGPAGLDRFVSKVLEETGQDQRAAESGEEAAGHGAGPVELDPAKPVLPSRPTFGKGVLRVFAPPPPKDAKFMQASLSLLEMHALESEDSLSAYGLALKEAMGSMSLVKQRLVSSLICLALGNEPPSTLQDIAALGPHVRERLASIFGRWFLVHHGDEDPAHMPPVRMEFFHLDALCAVASVARTHAERMAARSSRHSASSVASHRRARSRAPREDDTAQAQRLPPPDQSPPATHAQTASQLGDLLLAIGKQAGSRESSHAQFPPLAIQPPVGITARKPAQMPQMTTQVLWRRSFEKGIMGPHPPFFPEGPLSDFTPHWSVMQGGHRSLADPNAELLAVNASAGSPETRFGGFPAFLATVSQWCLAVAMMRRGPGEIGLPRFQSGDQRADWERVLAARRETATRRVGESDTAFDSRQRAAWADVLWFTDAESRRYIELLLQIAGTARSDGHALAIRYDAHLRRSWTLRTQFGEEIVWTDEFTTVNQDALEAAEGKPGRRSEQGRNRGAERTDSSALEGSPARKSRKVSAPPVSLRDPAVQSMVDKAVNARVASVLPAAEAAKVIASPPPKGGKQKSQGKPLRGAEITPEMIAARKKKPCPSIAKGTACRFHASKDGCHYAHPPPGTVPAVVPRKT